MVEGKGKKIRMKDEENEKEDKRDEERDGEKGRTVEEKKEGP